MTAILYPVAALAALTFAVLLLIPYARFRAAFQGRVTAKDFRFGESANVPPEVALPNRNLINLLVFYVTSSVDGLALTLAWLYVALRVAHSLVHLTYNNVFHRLTVYAASNVVLVVLWVRLTLALK